jgi:GR25 family glycosyltransferase involved in LPS biosynthesis
MQMENIPCFMISLKSDDKKRKKNLLGVKKLFPKTKVFDAFDARRLSDSQVKEYVHPTTYNQIKQKREVDMTHMSTKGAVGCFISHKNLWKKCIELDQPIIVCEDDINLDNKEHIRDIKKSFNDIPDKAVFAALIHNPFKIFIPTKEGTKVVSENWKTLGHDYTGTQMYYMTPYAAKTLLKYSEPIVNHVDIYIGQVGLQDGKLWIRTRSNINPQEFSQIIENSALSTIGHPTTRIKKLLPEDNTFYYIIIGISFLLIIIIILQRVKIRNLQKKI